LSTKSKTKEYLVKYDDLLFGLVKTWSRLSCSCLCFKKYQLKDNINRIYLILFQILYEKWLFFLSHLKPLVDNSFPHVGINNHKTQYYHLKVLFNKIKIYYNVIFVIFFYYCVFISDYMFFLLT
jgi:hypothetical protein